MKQDTTEFVALFGTLQQQLLKSEEREKYLLLEVKALREKLENPIPCPEIRRDWIPREEFKSFLNFGDTQMSAISKKYNFTYTEIGKRKFYQTSSIQKILENYKIN